MANDEEETQALVVDNGSTEYMDIKCGVQESGDETATFQYQECRKQFYKPGVYLSKNDVSCWSWSYPPKLNHLVISKKELRFSYAWYANEMKSKCCHSFWIACCCLGFQNLHPHNEWFGPVQSSSIFSYDVKRVELETFDLLKPKKKESFAFYNWFTMFLWACWQVYIVVRFQFEWYLGILKSNTTGVGVLVLEQMLPSFIMVCPLLISACTQAHKKEKTMKQVQQLLKQEQISQAVPTVHVEVPADAVAPVEDGSTALKDTKEKFQKLRRSCRVFGCATALTLTATVFSLVILSISTTFLNPMSTTIRRGVRTRKTSRRLRTYEIPPPEMFAGKDAGKDEYGPNETAILEVYKAHWDTQRNLIRRGHRRFLAEGNETASVCKNGRFDFSAHYYDTTRCTYCSVWSV